MSTLPDVADAPAAEDAPFDAEKSIAYLRERGVEVETAEDRAAAKQAAAQAPPTLAGGGKKFIYVKIPADTNEEIVELTANTAGGDVLPTLLAPAFADDGVLDQETVSRETAGRLKNMVVGGSDTINDKAVVAPSAEALQGMAKGGVVEAWPLAPADEENGHRAVRFYIDEVGALRGRPRNKRAENLATAVGLDGVAIHGDAYVGRVGYSGLAGRKEENQDFPTGDLMHNSDWVTGARRAHGKAAMNFNETQHLAEGGDGELFSWTQTDDEVEVRVLRGVPEGKATKKRIAVSYGRGGDALKVTLDKMDLFVVDKVSTQQRLQPSNTPPRGRSSHFLLLAPCSFAARLAQPSAPCDRCSDSSPGSNPCPRSSLPR